MIRRWKLATQFSVSASPSVLTGRFCVGESRLRHATKLKTRKPLVASQVIWRNIAWVLKKSVIGAGTAVVEEDFSIAKKMLALVLGIAVLSGAGSAVPRICSESNVGQHTRYLNQIVVQVGRTENSAYFRIARLRIDVHLASK